MLLLTDQCRANCITLPAVFTLLRGRYAETTLTLMQRGGGCACEIGGAVIAPLGNEFSAGAGESTHSIGAKAADAEKCLVVRTRTARTHLPLGRGAALNGGCGLVLCLHTCILNARVPKINFRVTNF